MPSSKRVSYSSKQKSFWIKLFYYSDFTGRNAKKRFLRDVRHQAELKVGEFYENIKNKKDIQYHLFIHLEGGCVVAKEALQTKLNSINQAKEECTTCKVSRVRLSNM